MGNVTSKWSVIILDFVHYNTLQRIIMLTPDFRRFRDGFAERACHKRDRARRVAMRPYPPRPQISRRLSTTAIRNSK